MSVQFAGQCPWAVSGKVWQKIRAVVALRAADTLGGSQAVSMALDVRQHGSKTPCRWLWWNGIYKPYGQPPMGQPMQYGQPMGQPPYNSQPTPQNTIPGQMAGVRCQQCGMMNNPGSGFCSACGNKL